ncbi:MAG: hypothetical protein J1F63_05825 [Oscillospiraceae bacterium]|nr:hypothetical protein [Oscillospiraceae bacterium]
MLNCKKNFAMLVCLAVALTLLLGLAVSSGPAIGAESFAAVSDEISVTVDGSSISFDVPPKIIDGTTMLPVRLALEPLGAEFAWNERSQAVTIRANGKNIVLTIGAESALVDGVSKPLMKPAMIIDGRTLIPIRFVAEELGYGVDWDSNTRTVIISSSDDETDDTITGYATRVLELVNEERAKEGLGPLKLDKDLCAVAKMHCDDMAKRNFFDHINPDGKSPFDRMNDYGIFYMAAGENIASGQRSPEAVMNAWMNSPGHRANILSEDFGKIGVGYAEGGKYGTLWAQCFTN